MLVLAVIVMAGTAGAVDLPAVQHDQRVEQAAAAIVARRMGDLRGGLDLGFRAEASQPARAARHSQRIKRQPRAGVWRDGLAVAIEKKTTVSPNL